MTADPPALDFPLYSEHSRTRHELPLRDLIACLTDELLRRRDFYPKLVARDAMRQDEADAQVQLLAAILVDVRHADYDDPDRPTERDGDHGYFPKVHCLRREIQMRRNMAKKQPARSVHDLAKSRRDLERLEAAHDWYWNGEGLNAIGSYDAYAAEMDRRNQWMAGQSWPLPAGEVEAIVTVHTRIAYPRDHEAGRYAQVARRFRHLGPGPFACIAHPNGPPSWRVVNADGDDCLWTPDLSRSLDRALHGPRYFHCADPIIHGRDILEAIAAALTAADELASAEPEILAAE